MGFDFAEVDLWWLLEEKHQYKEKHKDKDTGQVYYGQTFYGQTNFYNPKEIAFEFENNQKNDNNLILNQYDINEFQKIKANKDYKKKITSAQCKKYLMDAYEVKYQDLNYIPTIADHSYLEFYKLVLKDIESKINKK